MVPSNAIALGCFALTAATIWLGSFYLPNRKKSKHLPTVERPIQSNSTLSYRPDSLLHPVDPRRVHRDLWSTPNIRSLGYYRREQIRRAIHDTWRIPPSRCGQTQRNMTRALLDDWRRSIVGLIALSERNMKSAEDLFKTGNETAAVRLARIAVDNMARALIHCCGGKPDSDSGQEEVLRMLSLRFKADTRTAFENATDKIAYILISQEPKRTLQIASETTFTLKKLVQDNFRQEIYYGLNQPGYCIEDSFANHK